MSRPRVELDLAAPVRSLLAAAGVSTYQAAAARGCAQATISSAQYAGRNVKLSSLVTLASALGLSLVVSVEPTQKTGDGAAGPRERT